MHAMIKKLTVTTLLALSLAAIPAGAIPINITMLGDHSVAAVPKSALGNFGDSTVFNWLKNDVTAYNTAFSTSFSTPTANPDGSPLSKVETYFGPRSVTLTVASQEYVFLHWGGHNGGYAQAYYNDGNDASYTFRAPSGSGVGGLSFYSTYGSSGGGSVPEGGITIGLLGMAMGGLVLLRKP